MNSLSLKCVAVVFGLLGVGCSVQPVSFGEPESNRPVSVDTWPSCERPSHGAEQLDVAEVWGNDPLLPEPVWLEDVVVTATSRGGCRSHKRCVLFIQQRRAFDRLEHARGGALRVEVAAEVSDLFEGIQPMDVVDLQAYAWRSTDHGQGSLRLHVGLEWPGCIKRRGVSSVQPVPVSLDELTVRACQEEFGPLFVVVRDVVGVPKAPFQTFSLRDGSDDAPQSYNEVTSVSPYLLSEGKFVGLETGKPHHFTSVTGVFDVYTPSGGASKYEHIYVRDMLDLIH